MKSMQEYRVLSPVANPEHVEQLASLAAALAKANDGQVLALHIQTEPDAGQIPPVLARAEQIMATAGVPVRAIVQVGRDAVTGILEAAREAEANAIVIGWKPQPRTRDRLLGSTLDRLLADPPCDVLILRAGTFHEARHILVPLSRNAQNMAALRHALRLAEEWDGQVTVITVVGVHATEMERAAVNKDLREALGKYSAHPRLTAQVIAAPSPVEGIIQQAATHDLVMLDTSQEGIIVRVLFGDVPEKVAAATDTPVVVVKRRVGPVTHWLRRGLDRASAMLPRLTDVDRVEVYKAIRRSARPDADYFFMIGLAAGIAALGLLLNSPAVIIGAMLVAPLMAAIVGLGMGVVMGDLPLLRMAASATLRGMLLATGVGIVAGSLALDPTPTAEILGRTQPTLLDLGVALVSGAAGAYALCRKDVSASLPGVAIAAALVPPLTTVGIGLRWGSLAIAGGTLLLFLTNLIAISVASTIVFLLFGFRPGEETERINILRRGGTDAIALLILAAATLGVLTYRLVSQVRFSQDVRAAVAAEVSQLGQADVADRDAVAAMFAGAIEQFGRIDIAVANAAKSIRETVIEAKWEHVLRTIQVSQFGVFHTCQMAAQQMVKQGHGGKIVIISSVLEEIATPTSAAYNMAKAAINHLGRTMATELAPHRINVNIIDPGWIDTPGERAFATEDEIRAGAKRILWGRMGTAEDIGKAVAFLVSDDADYVTGSTLRVDGGYVLSLRLPQGHE